jgi:hypothetical protein
MQLNLQGHENLDDEKNPIKPLFRDAFSDDIIYSNRLSPHAEIHKPGAMWIPAIGLTPWDGHVYISGATGSGKSFMINKILEMDNQQEDRERVLFTDLAKKDKSITAEHKKFGEKGVDTNFVQGNLDGGMFIFDDVTDPDALALQNKMLLKGRHRKATVVAVNHRLREGMITRPMINESRYIVTFPSSNRGSVSSFMKDFLEIDTKSRRKILQTAVQQGRHLVFHMQNPNAAASTESAWLI